MAPFQALYRRRCTSLVWWYEVGEFALLGLDFAYEALEKVWYISDILIIARSQQNSYADNRERDLEFEVRDWVHLKIHP